jgi:hypothetical protein
MSNEIITSDILGIKQITSESINVSCRSNSRRRRRRRRRLSIDVNSSSARFC